MELNRVVTDIADALVAIDSARKPFKHFGCGVGPYGEPQLLGLIAAHLNTISEYGGKVRTKRTPDLLIEGHWAVECKLARPFGDNGKPAESWSVNLLHPYPGNVSLIGDCLKLRALELRERKAALVVGYEHTPPQISLAPLLSAFELISTTVLNIALGERTEVSRTGLVHSVHQQLVVSAWEVL